MGKDSSFVTVNNES